MSDELVLDPELEAFYRAERAAPPTPPAGAKARSLAATLARINAGGGGPDGQPTSSSPGPSTPPSIPWSTVLGTLSLGALLGAAVGVPIGRWVESPAPSAIVASERPAPRSIPQYAPALAPTETPVSGNDAGLVRRPVARSRGAHRAELVEESASAPLSATAQERVLIDRARSALRRDQPHEALVALMAHERQFESGVLREERERLIIESLVAQRRSDLARDRIERYLRNHPHGIHRADLEALLRTLP